MKPESGCSGPFSPPTALRATELDMKHDTTWHLTPTFPAPAAGGVTRLHGKETTTNARGVRLFKV